MKKKVLIVTINDYIIYQPTLLNLYDALKDMFDVTVISFEPEAITKRKDDKRNIVYLKTERFWKEFYQKMDFLMFTASKYIRKFLKSYNYSFLYYNYYLPRILEKNIKSYSSDIVIAVDVSALYISQKVFGEVHFLSLELDIASPHYKKINTEKIKSVIIQSKIRYDYLFPDKQLTTFYIQNAPVFKNKYETNYERKDFIWAGTITEEFGIIDCLNFFKAYPQYRIVLKGGSNKKAMNKIEREFELLINEGIISINQTYLQDAVFIDFISHFKIGFCFYSWNLINKNFNYRTAPSGKLFMCLAAGTPVIACNIPGFDFINEFKAGVLIDDYRPETILNAALEIERNFMEYSTNAYKAAKHFDFKQSVQPYIEFLQKE